MGMDAPDLPFATGLLDTDYAGKARAVLEALDAGYDFAVLHVEAPDEASHEGSLEDKLEAIRRIDRLALAPLLRPGGRFPADADARSLHAALHPHARWHARARGGLR